MKKNNIAEYRKMDSADLKKQIKQFRLELNSLLIDKNTGKLTDLKVANKKRHEVAQMFTVLNQKVMLENLEKNNA